MHLLHCIVSIVLVNATLRLSLDLIIAQIQWNLVNIKDVQVLLSSAGQTLLSLSNRGAQRYGSRYR